MKKTTALIVLFLLLVTNAVMGEVKGKRFRADLMVAEPNSSVVQGLYGHAFIRMQYPEEGLDYCFTLETEYDDESPIDFLTGNYSMSVMAFSTPDYMKQFEVSHRALLELPLNLTDHEIQTLWRKLDERISDKNQNIIPDYFTHGCSAEIMDIIFSSLDGYVEFDNIVLDSIGMSYMQVAGTYRPLWSWSIVCAGFCLAEGMHVHRSAECLTCVPVSLPFMLSHASVVSETGKRSLLASTSATFRDGDGSVKSLDVNRVHFFKEDSGIKVRIYIIVLIVMLVLIGVFRRGWLKYTGGLLFVIYNLIMVSMIIVNVMTDIPEFKGWNWQILFYNPLPAMLWLANRVKPVGVKTKKRIFDALIAWAALCVIVAVIRCDMFLIENVLISIVFTIQLFLQGYYLNTNKY